MLSERLNCVTLYFEGIRLQVLSCIICVMCNVFDLKIHDYHN